MGSEVILALVIAFLAVIGALVLWLEYSWSRTKTLVDEFRERWPEKCLICAFHSYGIRHGYIEWGSRVQPHECVYDPAPDARVEFGHPGGPDEQ